MAHIIPAEFRYRPFYTRLPSQQPETNSAPSTTSAVIHESALNPADNPRSLGSRLVAISGEDASAPIAERTQAVALPLLNIGNNEVLAAQEYNGPLLNGLPHGQGELILSDGSVYTGNFQHGKPIGRGLWHNQNGLIFLFLDGQPYTGWGDAPHTIESHYTGNFKEGLPHGEGTLTDIEGDTRVTYQGIFDCGQPQGEFSVQYPDRTCEIQFVKGQPSDQGAIAYHNGDVYVGGIDALGLPCGQGKMTYVNQCDCTGNFQDGLLHGEGTQTYLIEGITITYRGTFERGQLHGPITIRYPDRTCEGTYEHGQPVGNGKITYDNEDVYKGGIDAIGQPCGMGEIKYAHGGKHQGNFDKGVLQGIGQCYFTDGTSLIIHFRDGQPFGVGIKRTPDGQFILCKEDLERCRGQDLADPALGNPVTKRYPNGCEYVGQLDQNGFPSGYGKMTYADGKVYKGRFEKGWPEGPGFMQITPTEYELGEFRKGKLHGLGLRKVSNGIHGFGNFENDLPHGTVWLLDPRQGFFFGTYKNGQISGPGKLIHNDGTELIGIFKNGGVFGSDGSHLGEARSLSKILGLGGSAGGMPGDNLGTIVGFLGEYNYEKYTPELRAAHLRLLVEDLQQEAEKIHDSLTKAKQPELLMYGASGISKHAMGLRLVPDQDGNFIYCQIFNSGAGLSQYHGLPQGNKFKTMIQIRVPVQKITPEKIHLFLNYLQFPTVDDAYKAVLDLGEIVPPPPGEEIWQAFQKANNCTLEWIFAYLKYIMPDDEYKEMRSKLFELTVQQAEQSGSCNAQSLLETHAGLISEKLSKKRKRVAD